MVLIARVATLCEALMCAGGVVDTNFNSGIMCNVSTCKGLFDLKWLKKLLKKFVVTKIMPNFASHLRETLTQTQS
jgi:hypothetical protein